MGTARNLAIANENNQIDASAVRAASAVKPRTALEAMALRLQISPASLTNTLKATVFSACRTNKEFVALVIVSNEYRLNPLLKEIFAFPTKAGGIQAMVSVDGWIRMMNEHPAFDGIEFEYINDDNGQTEAIEAVICRSDRRDPIKIIEYMDECKRNTDPWRTAPRRMLRHRALMQCARVAFGFSGIAVEGDVIEGDYREVPTGAQALPSAQSLAEELGDEIPAFDKDTGEVLDDRGMTQVSEGAARELDEAGQDGGFNQDFGLADAVDPATVDQPDEALAWTAPVAKVRAKIEAATDRASWSAADAAFQRIMAGLPDDVREGLDGELQAKRKSLAGEAK